MIIVTGGAGFIGSALVWALNRRGEEEILVVDELGLGEKWKNLRALRYVDFMHKEEFIHSTLEQGLPPQTRAVLHMGACSTTTERDADYLMENNVHYSMDLCRAALDAGARFLYASSAATYGDGSLGYDDAMDAPEKLRPLNMYGYSKQLFDLWIRREELAGEVAGFKFFNVFGPNEYHKGEMRSMVHKAFGQIRETGRARLFANHREGHENGDEKRDFIYIKDAVETVLHVLENPSINGVFNLGTGEARSFLDLATAVFHAMEREVEIEWFPMPEELREQYQYFTEAKMERLAQTGAPVPSTPLEEAVDDYVRGHLLGPSAWLEP